MDTDSSNSETDQNATDPSPQSAPSNNPPDNSDMPVPDSLSIPADAPEVSTSSPISPSAPASVIIPAIAALVPVLPISAVPVWDPHSGDEIGFLKSVLGPKAWAAHRARTAARLEKVMELARSKDTIDRTDVRLHLDVSQAAATRYLSALVKQGRLVRRHTQDDNVYTAAE